MTPHEQLAGTLKAIMKKRLEQVVQDNILLVGKGKLTDLNLVQYEKLAREHGFTDVADDLSDLVSMLGSAFVEHLRYKELIINQERNYPERDLEDYLVAGRLDLIEKGIKFVDRQYECKSGILDIFAKDAADKDLVIELKMGKYNAKNVIKQIERYLSEHVDARLFFVAPEISGTVYHEFKELVAKGKVTFYKVAENGQDYIITHEDGSTITKSRKFKNGTKPKQTGQPVYDVFSIKKPRGTKKAPETPTTPAKESSTEMVQQHIDHAKQTPTAVMHLDEFVTKYNIPTDHVIAAAEIYEVTAVQKRALKELIMPPALNAAIEEYLTVFSCLNESELQNTPPPKVDKLRRVLSNDKEMQKFSRSLELVRTLRAQTLTIFTKFFETFNTENLGERVRWFHQMRVIQVSLITEKDATRYLKQVEDLVRTDPQDKSFQLMRLNSTFSDLNLVIEAGLVEGKRIHELDKIDPVLRIAYQQGTKNAFAIKLQYLQGGQYGKIESLLPESFVTAVRDTSNLYARFVNAFTLKTESSARHNEASPEKPQTVNPLQQALFKEINGNASPDVRLRMDYFIQDASAFLPPDKSAQLGEAFEQFKFARKFRKREVQPTDVKIRNFFDDVTLDIRKGTVPDADALERLYERA